MKNIAKYILIFSGIISYLFFIKAYPVDKFVENYNYSKIQDFNDTNLSTSYNEEILFIVDFSNSMNKKMGYTPKVYYAIDAIREILSKSGDRTKIGLRIFGVTDKPVIERDGKGYSWHKENLCSASTLVMPIARYNAVNISDKLGQLNPQGVSPIGYSLRQAIQNDFSPAASLKHIILVTDGVENCGDDPCFYIRRIMQLSDDIKIDVIGITVSENALSQLNCIAKYSNGKYYSVNTPDDFQIKFDQAFYSETPNSDKPKTNTIKKYISPESGIKYKSFILEFDN